MVVSVALLGFGPLATAATQVGFKAHSYAGFNAETTGGAITGQKPESKLWFNAGKWWAVMLSPTNNGAHTIWRLDDGGWANTGVVVDGRAGTKEDVLWTGSSLYITSRSAGASNLLRRFSWNGSTYTLDAGFPATLPVSGPETLTIARDSLGVLWITFELSNNVYVARSQGSDTLWTAPAFVIPVSEASGLNADDISSVISFTDATGPAIGVGFTRQTNPQGFFFAVHRDGAPDSSWTVEGALLGQNLADDHINLKTFEGRVYAVVKARHSAILIRLLVRSTSGVWTWNNVATDAEGDTRPIAVLNIDPSQRKLYVFMTKGEGAAATGIFLKVASIDAISFGPATPFIQGPSGEIINDATSTKQNTDASTGLVVLASDGTDYWWNRIGGGTAGAPPSATAGSAVTTEDTPVQVTLRGGDPDTCDLTFALSTAPAHGSVGPITNQPCSPGSPNTDQALVTYTPAANYFGSDSFTFTVNDGSTTSSPEAETLTISGVNDAPTAVPGSATTSVGTPVTVPLSGTDPEACTLTFAVGTGPAHGSLGGILDAACSPGTPNVDRASVVYTPAGAYTGPDSFTYTVSDGTLTSPPATISISITQGATGISLRSASSGANTSATSLTIPAPAGVGSGDVMLAGISVRGTPNLTSPAGWTLVRLDLASGNTMRQAIYVKVAASEPANYTWTFSTGQAAAGGIVAYAGVDTATPIDAHSGKSGRGFTIIAPSVATTVNGAMIVGFFGHTTNTTITAPGGMTERYDVASTAAPYFITSEGCDVLQPTAGASGDKIATAGTQAVSVGQLVALRPAGAGPPPSPTPTPSPSPTKPPRG